jgi:hypothetical protein
MPKIRKNIGEVGAEVISTEVVVIDGEENVKVTLSDESIYYIQL